MDDAPLEDVSVEDVEDEEFWERAAKPEGKAPEGTEETQKVAGPPPPPPQIGLGTVAFLKLILALLSAKAKRHPSLMSVCQRDTHFISIVLSSQIDGDVAETELGEEGKRPCHIPVAFFLSFKVCPLYTDW